MSLLKMLNEAANAKTPARKVEDYINKHFYVYNDSVSGDDQIVYEIEESKARYEIRVYGTKISVTANIESGANKNRAAEIKKLLTKASLK